MCKEAYNRNICLLQVNRNILLYKLENVGQ